MNPAPRPTPVSRRRFLGQLSLGAAVLGLPFRLRAESTPPPRKLGIALVGLGSYSTRQLAPALQLTQNCRLAGVVTGEREKGKKWAQAHGFPEQNIFSYDTMPEIAGNPDIDIVYVVTPNGLHAQHVIAAAKAGKHVITEKPMANTVAECEAMIAACRAANVKLSVGYRLHFDPYHQTMMRMARDPETAPFAKMNSNRAFALPVGAWRGDKKLAGGGPMMDIGIYIIQAACMAYGGFPKPGGGLEAAPVAVTAHELPKTKPQQFGEGVEETMEFTLEFANGAVCTARTSYVGPTSDQFRAEGPKAWIEFKEHAFGYRGLVVDSSKGPLHFDPPVNQQALQMDDFAQCVRAGRESRVPGEMGRRDLAIIEAVYAAAKSGRKTPVKI
jgi:glucose-fructose oxidoreductase